MRRDLPRCLPVPGITGTTKTLFAKQFISGTTEILKMKNNISMLLLMIFSFSINAFAQPAKIDLDQARNGGNSGLFPISPIDWVNGNLGSANSHYREGYSVPYRARINNIPTGTPITVVFGYDIKHSDKNALDYLTYYRRNQPHGNWNPEHNEENVDPLLGATGNYGDPTFYTIPCPTINASYTPPTVGLQPSTSCANLPAVTDFGLCSGVACPAPVGFPGNGQHAMTIFNGTISNIVYSSNGGFLEGDLNAAQSEARIAVTFTASSSDVVLAWGGHIASRLDWGYDANGVPRSAGGISGSPYHMRIVSWAKNLTGFPDNDRTTDDVLPNLGNTDRSLSAAAVVPPPPCPQYTGSQSPSCGASISYSVSIPSGCTNPTFTWSFSSNTSGATFVGGNTGTSVTVSVGTCGSFCLLATGNCTEGPTSTACPCYTVTVADNTPPVFTGSYATADLGCNPTDIGGALGSATATDGCGSASVNSGTDGTDQSSGCLRTRTRTFTATDGCGNTATTSRSVTWTADNTPPVFTGSYATTDLGCNPTNISATLNGATASDGCGTPTTSTGTDGADQSNGCLRTRTRTFTSTDACGNTSTISRSVTWTDDHTAPVFTNCSPDIVIECDASIDPANIPGGAASATDNCGSVTPGYSDNTITRGCITYITRTWTATDACGNSASCVQNIIKRDRTAPVFVTCAVGSATATDNCTASGDIIIYKSGDTWVATDGSGNQATCTAGSLRTAAAPVQEQQVTQQTDQTKSTLQSKTAVQSQPTLSPGETTVTAYPNPFNNKVKFLVMASRPGYGTLELINMQGQLIKTIYQGQIPLGGKSFEVTLPAVKSNGMIYRLKMGDKQITGKLIQLN